MLLSGYLGGFAYEVREVIWASSRALQAEPDGRGGAWIVYDAKGGGSAFLHVGVDSVDAGGSSAPPKQKASVRDLAIQPESGSVWAVGAASPGRDGLIWAYRR